MRERLESLLDGETTDDPESVGSAATATAIQAAVWREGEWVYRGAHGHRSVDPLRPTELETYFDLASLTKPIATASLAARAVDEGRAGWRDPVGRHLRGWPEPAETGRGSVTLLQLLNHTAGLPDWRPFYEDHPYDPSRDRARRTRREVVDAITATRLERAPGRRENYSDLGYIVLAALLGDLFGSSFERAVETHVLDLLGLDGLTVARSWAADPELRRAAVTEIQPERGGALVGRVHDRNAAVLGGVSGHAGLFGTAEAVARVGRHLLRIEAGDAPDDPLVSRDLLDWLWSPASRGGIGHHLAGWDTPSGDRPSAGRGFAGGDTVGHLGFTGTSLWIERDSRTVAVLLTNRVFPERDNDRIDDLRVAFHETVLPPGTTSSAQ